MRTSLNGQAIIRYGLYLSALCSGPVLGVAAFQIARSLGVHFITSIMLSLGCVLLGITLWNTLKGIHRLTTKLDTATSDPFGLQYQRQEWWTELHSQFPDADISTELQYDEDIDQT